jgi:hypothetical protein
MPCALCGTDAKLIEAHVIPRSFHRLDPSERRPAVMLTNVPGRHARKLRKGAYDPGIVCEPCEHRFSAWDDHAAELLIERWGEYQPLVHHNRTIGFTGPAYDYAKLKLFFISLLWRASVSTHDMFYQVQVGPHEAALRRHIFQQDPGAPDDYGAVLQAFDTTEVGMLNPHPERFSGVRFVRFYLAHIIAYVKVDRRPMPGTFCHMMLRPGVSSLVLAQKNFLQSPERALMREMVLADHAKRSS